MRPRPQDPTRVSFFARPGRALLAALLALGSRSAIAASTGPYDLSAVDALLQAELPDLHGHVAVLVRQNGKEIYRFQAGDIGYDTRTRMASFTKTVSAAVVLALRDEGLLSLEERLGSALPAFESHGLGDPTILDAWGMRHGIDSAVAYEHDSRFTLEESVDRLATFGYVAFSPPGSQLGYDGAGMQAVGRIAELRAGGSWEEIARSRILDPCGMPQTDFGQFSPNPSVPGGLRSTPEESMRFAQMVIDGGWSSGRRVLSDASIEQLFTNSTRALPVFASPWPASHPLYPYGAEPDYGFGDWVIAEDPAIRYVEEVVGAGAWGSYIWIDRRRGVTAVLFTDVPPGSQASLDSALGLFELVRRQLEAAQVARLAVSGSGAERSLSWMRPAAATATRLFGSNHPIRSIYDLRAARLLLETSTDIATVPAFPYYAATAVLGTHENTALVPGENALAGSAGGSALLFHPVTPCRIVDTRNQPDGPLTGPILGASPAERVFAIVPGCGLPADARVVSANVTVTGGGAAGDLRIFPADTALPFATTISFGAGRTRANNAMLLVSEGPDTGRVTVRNDSAAPIHLIVDVNGYFR